MLTPGVPSDATGDPEEPAADFEQHQPGPRRPRSFAVWIMVIAAVIIAVDQLTKWWAEANLVLGEPTPVIGELIQWRLIYNPGAAFGLAAEYTWVLTIVAAVAVVGLVLLAIRTRTMSWAIGVGMLLGGAASHLGDRLTRDPGFARGHIVDFIDYAGFFVGNVADIAIVGGAAYLVVLSLLGISYRPSRTSDAN